MHYCFFFCSPSTLGDLQKSSEDKNIIREEQKKKKQKEITDIYEEICENGWTPGDAINH